jgi:hypothetical protein
LLTLQEEEVLLFEEEVLEEEYQGAKSYFKTKPIFAFKYPNTVKSELFFIAPETNNFSSFVFMSHK